MNDMNRLKILITVKTHPIPSKTYDELVCTAGVTENGDFIRLYPINFRDLPFSQQYKKYQWIEVMAAKHVGRDVRKESYRPDCDSIRTIGEPITTKNGDWSERTRYVLNNKANSIEDLKACQKKDRTSLGIFKPDKVEDLVISEDTPEWKPAFLQELRQARLWETRRASKEPPRKVPFKFHYHFKCDDKRCNGHKMMIEDWEVGALFWKLVDQGETLQNAAKSVRDKFLNDLCSANKGSRIYNLNI